MSLTDSLDILPNSDDFTTFFIAIGFILCLVASVLRHRHNIILALLCCPFFLAFCACLVFVRRLNLIIAEPTLWDSKTIFASLVPIPVLGYLISLVCFKLLAVQPTVAAGDFPKAALWSVFQKTITACLVSIPCILYLSAHNLSDSTSLLISSPFGACIPFENFDRKCPVVCTYVDVVFNLSASLTEPLWREYAPCFIRRSASKVMYDELRHFPYILLFVYVSLIVLSMVCNGLCSRFLHNIDEQWRYLATDPFEYLHFHWTRLNVPRVFLAFWLMKLLAVFFFGHAYWPIEAVSLEVSAQTVDESGILMRSSLNFTFLNKYANEDSLQPSYWARYQSRFLTGILAIGSETWTSVYGAAVFLGLLSGVLVKLLAFFVDPFGETVAQLAETAEADPVAANPWAPIEDQLLNNNHIEVTAIELLNNTSWSCVVLFAFLAIQYDLPNLGMHQRVFCCIHLFIVMGFTCVYPIESLVKAILLRLGIPGRDSSWFDHVIPLIFCGLMLAVAGCVFVYFPAWLSYLPYTGRGYQLLTHDDVEVPTAADAGITAKPTVAFSANSSYAQRLRTYLCGGQLLLDVTCTLIEYVLHQVHKRRPTWTGFSTLLSITRLINIFINYLISLLSVLVILWLIFYESFGICRVFILVVHVSCVLYPATYRGLSWLRWRLLFVRSFAQIRAPTEAELDANADDCPICYSEMNINDSKLTRCGHVYHVDCLSQWMRRQSFCPICNSDLFSSTVRSTRFLNIAADT